MIGIFIEDEVPSGSPKKVWHDMKTLMDGRTNWFKCHIYWLIWIISFYAILYTVFITCRDGDFLLSCFTKEIEGSLSARINITTCIITDWFLSESSRLNADDNTFGNLQLTV